MSTPPRTYRCQDCPPEAGEHPAGARGPLPERCPAHRARREAQQTRRRRRRLHVVDEDTPQTPDPGLVGQGSSPAPGQAPPPEAATVAEQLEQDLAELATDHPAARSLMAAARRIAALIDDPYTLAQDGPRVIPSLTRELRSIIEALIEHQEAEDDDLFGAGGPTPVVIPASS